MRKWVHIAHHLPGRLRLRFNSALVAKLAQYKTEQLMQQIVQFEPVKNYQLNTQTQSVLLEYHAAIVPPHLLEQVFADNESEALAACNQLIDILTPYYQGLKHG